nr:ABC transporter substrate-binding protein [uncultured Holophaga sp.]
MLPLKPEDRPLLSPHLSKLPVIGGRSGAGNTTNMEVLLQNRPDLMLMWTEKKHGFTQPMDELQKLGIPTATVQVDGLDTYPEAFRFMGRLVDRVERCNRMAAHTERVMSQVRAAVKRIPPERRLKVYYAEGADGLSTECSDSIHAELLQLAGDCNVHRGHISNPKGMERISLEQVLLYNPDALVVQDRAFYDKVWSDPAWKGIKAVKTGRIYLVPQSPLNWMDRPPSFMRILGVQWLMHSLYPQDYPIDIVREARTFFSLFLGAQVSEAQMHKVIYRQ